MAYSYLEQFSYSGTCSTNAKSLIELPFLGPNMLASQEPHYSFFSGILAIFILYLKLTVFFFLFLLIRRSCYRFCFWACLFIRAILTSSSSFSSASGSQLSKWTKSSSLSRLGSGDLTSTSTSGISSNSSPSPFFYEKELTWSKLSSSVKIRRGRLSIWAWSSRCSAKASF